MVKHYVVSVYSNWECHLLQKRLQICSLNTFILYKFSGGNQATIVFVNTKLRVTISTHTMY